MKHRLRFLSYPFLVVFFLCTLLCSNLALANTDDTRWYPLEQSIYGQILLDTQTVRYNAAEDKAMYWVKYTRSPKRDGNYEPEFMNHELIDFKNQTVTIFGRSLYINGAPTQETTKFEAPEGNTFTLFPHDEAAYQVALICGRTPLFAKPHWETINDDKAKGKIELDLNNVRLNKKDHQAIVYIIKNQNYYAYRCDFTKGSVAIQNVYSRSFRTERIPVPESSDEIIYNEAYRLYQQG